MKKSWQMFVRGTAEGIAITIGCVLCAGVNCAETQFYPEADKSVESLLQLAAANTEALSDPVGLTLATGSDILAAGVGLVDGQPDNIEINIPVGVVIKQVILYWEGQETTETGQGDTDQITLNGTLDVTGDRIGGPTGFLSDYWTSTYRADITGLNLLAVGPNSISVEGLDFDQRNNGAGILVVVDDGINTTDLQLKDGNDFAFIHFAPPLNTTEQVTFNFAAAPVQRTASLNLFVSSVAREDPSGGIGRPSIIEISIDGLLADSLVDSLANSDGPEWDTVRRTVIIPAGATSLTVQILSEDAGTGPFAGNLPASLTWLAASFAILPPEPEEGDEGCTPGYWKQSQHFGDWTQPYDPTDLFSSVFDDAFPGKTLLEVAGQGGGGLKALGRHTVAALLNAASPDVDYPLTVQEVINAFNAAYPGTQDAYEDLKDEFEDLNESFCPLGRAEVESNSQTQNDEPGKKPKKK